jgi:hypothetical protein
VFPADGGETEGTDIVFAWTAPGTGAGGEMADYHFELSEYPDMRWPLSPNFRKLISGTADKGRPQYALPYTGLLAPDREYYWRVRAKNAQGVWGPFSATSRFTPRGPTPPEGLTIRFDAARGTGVLRWRPSPAGRAPVRYRVYGSDEKGFTASDEPYPVMRRFAGDWRKAACSDLVAANFVGETADTELTVIGRRLDLPNTNKAFYRVVAVDERGNRSWSSAYAESPRPFIFTTPVARARVGKEYRYQADTIRSLGHAGLRNASDEQVCEFWPPEERERILNGPSWHRQVVSFWDVQETRFSLVRSPDWLTVDEATGLLSGIPDAPGRSQVTLSVVLRRKVDELDLERLAWGHRVVTGTTADEEGPATQDFAIDVEP